MVNMGCLGLGVAFLADSNPGNAFSREAATVGVKPIQHFEERTILSPSLAKKSGVAEDIALNTRIFIFPRLIHKSALAGLRKHE